MADAPILPARIAARLSDTSLSVTLRTPDGRSESYGEKPRLVITVHSPAGLRALTSLNELKIVDAYLNSDIDLDGDLVSGMDLRHLLSDRSVWLSALTFLQSFLVIRRRRNPDWVAKHYDSGNIQLYAIDRDLQVYTPGLYLADDDSLEVGAERKLEYAFRVLRLRAGASVLDVGCGWGGFARYCARRGVDFTGISLSEHQLAFARDKLAAEGLDAQLLYRDFFAYEPERQFDAINLMGSIEELADYPEVLTRIDAWLKPGGLVYLDFAAVDRPRGVAAFVTRYVWPGAFRMVHMPSFIAAVNGVEFDVVDIRNDRRNYHLWAKGGYERWMEHRADVVRDGDERTWRLMRVLFAGTSHLMGESSTWATAYRVVLERRAAPALDGASARMFDRAGVATDLAGR